MRVWSGRACAAVLVGAFASLPVPAQTGQPPANPQPANTQSNSVEELFRQGATAMHSGHPAEAERSFRQAVQIAPELPDAHLDLGLILGREGKIDEAIQELRRALELNPKLRSGHMFLGIFLYQTGHADEAIHDLQQELALTPDNAETLTWLGIAELAAGHPEKATAPLDRAAELDPDNLDLLEYRGKAHSQVAAASYAHMAKLSPDNWHVRRVRAQMLSSEGRHADAIAELEAAVKLAPTNPDLWEGLGEEYRTSDQLEKAQAAFGKEMELSPGNPLAMYNLGSVDVERGDAAAGVPLLQQMIGGYQGSPVVDYYLGRGLAAIGKPAEAATWLERSAAADPAGEIGKRSSYELVRVYRKLGHTDEAARAQAQYDRIRAVTDKDYNERREGGADWRKLGAGAPATGATP